MMGRPLRANFAADRPKNDNTSNNVNGRIGVGDDRGDGSL